MGDLKPMFTRSLNQNRSRLLCIALAGLLACVFSQPVYSARRAVDTHQYDDQIRSAWRRYLPIYHWGIGWAQISQESAFNTNAQSPVGASGLAQFMPLTWQDMKRAGVVPIDASPRDARHAIQAQSFYMWRLTRTWSTKRADGDRIRLALASYNAGAGNIIKAQSKCGMPLEYDAIMCCLPRVTGRYAAETLDYVPRIEVHYNKRFNENM